MRRINTQEAEFLRRQITDSGLSVCDLAQQSRVPQPVLTRFIKRQQGMLLETAQKVAQSIGVDMTDAESQFERATWTFAQAVDLDFIPATYQEGVVAYYEHLWEEALIQERTWEKFSREQRRKAKDLQHLAEYLQEDGYDRYAKMCRQQAAEMAEEADEAEERSVKIQEARERDLAPWMEVVNERLKEARQAAKSQGRTRKKVTSNN
jgi:hypothetical protein